MVTVKEFFSGRISREFMLSRLVPVLLLIFMGSFLVANLLYPTAYDWRYVVISGLLSPEDNPVGYIVPTVGMTVAGVLMIPFVGYYHRRLNKICRGTTIAGSIFLVVAIFGLVSMATIGQVFTLVPELHQQVPKMHEYLSVLAFLGLLLMAFFYGFSQWMDHLKGRKQFDFRLMVTSAAILWFAFAGMVLCFAGVELLEPEGAGWGWVSLEWIDKGVPLVLSFALWEWILFVSLMIYIVLLAIMVPDEVHPLEKTAGN